ncbi:MAG: glutamate--cysteine ligase, partial [Candidatus Omnitrophica bacterium]|nr:glutamate--cysteine ligase [Candidatus Omnitrophota bacterium]
RTGYLDNRMEFYRTNSMRIPSVSGKIAPEPVYTRSEYEKRIFQVMYDDIRPLDPAGVLHHEWLNARGAIARFDRSAIEIRVLDVQECPQADLAAAYAAASTLQRLLSEEWSDLDAQKSAQTDLLLSIFLQTIREAENAVIQDRNYLALFGMGEACTAKELWEHILSRALNEDSEFAPPLRLMLEQGSLASRILRRLGDDDSMENIAAVYGELADCLEAGRMFTNE